MSSSIERNDALPPRSRLRRLLRIAFLPVQVLVILALGTWATLAIHFSNLPGGALRTAAAALFAGGFLLAFLFLRDRRRTMSCFLAAFGAVLVWWITIRPSNDRDWKPEYAVLARAEIDGDRVTIRNIRDFDHRTETEFTPRYYDRTFDLKDLETLDFVKSDWGLGKVAHTLLTFGFRGGDHVTVSIETRLERGEPQSGLGGLFKQYEVIYVLGDERDLIRLRTSFRHEDVYLYPTKTTPERVRILFLDILRKVDRLAEEPEFYNTLSNNCTTSFLPHLDVIRPRPPFDIRLWLNGFSDQLGYERGWFDSSIPFEELRKIHHINQYVKDHPEPEGYSRRIRPDLSGDRSVKG